MVSLRPRFAPLLALAASFAAVPLTAATPTATYRVRFDATWSGSTHPGAFPDGGHFSSLVGGVHDGDVRFWRPGGLASRGIERMAEEGRTSPLDQEVADAVAAGDAREVVLGGPIGRSPGSAEATFTASKSHRRVTLVSMIAPSPDWFVGVRDVELLVGGEWLEEISMPLFAYDAGTDDGADFTSPDAESDPHVPIARIDSGGFDNGVPLGTFTFTRIDEPLPPAAPLLLHGGRFEVRAVWADYQGRQGNGVPEALSSDSGTFWFFSASNVELVVKVLDGCGTNGHYWVFAGGLTDIEVELEVTDTTTGQSRGYDNLLGSPFEAVRDTAAFAACP